MIIIIVSLWMMAGTLSVVAIERRVVEPPWGIPWGLTQGEQMFITLLWPVAWIFTIWTTIKLKQGETK